MTEDLIAKWTRWIEGPIADDVLTIHLQRDSWRKVQEIVQENGALPDSYWWEFMFATYSVTQAVAVRRQTDTHPRVSSLGKLIQEIGRNPELVTRESWIGQWDPADERMIADLAEPAWTDQFGGGEELDPAIPREDLKELRRASRAVTKYVNRGVAHLQAPPPPVDHKQRPPNAPQGSPTALTLAEVHGVIDTIGGLFRKYHNLLTANTYADLVPVIQHPWLDLFRVPWIKPE